MILSGGMTVTVWFWSPWELVWLWILILSTLHRHLITTSPSPAFSFLYDLFLLFRITGSSFTRTYSVSPEAVHLIHPTKTFYMCAFLSQFYFLFVSDKKLIYFLTYSISLKVPALKCVPLVYNQMPFEMLKGKSGYFNSHLSKRKLLVKT